MKTDHDYQILEAMQTYGGSFVKQLSVLCRLADETNFQKLKTTFANYWTEYESFLKKTPWLSRTTRVIYTHDENSKQI